jgi:Fungal protein of unknown function (DUF2015)
VTYRYRASIISYIPGRVKSLFPKLGDYTPLSTFSDQVGAGMTSNDFDIEANINSGDSRVGLDERGTQEVLEIMRRERVKYVLRLFLLKHSHLIVYSFDQARLIRQNRILARNGIDPSGLLIGPRLTCTNLN